MSAFVSAGTTTARINSALDEGVAPHLIPILIAVRDHRVGMLSVPQGPQAFPFPPSDRRKAVVLLGDDLDTSVGPEGFHMPSVRRLIRACGAFAVISSAADPAVYAALTTAAVAGKHALIVETRLAHEFQWVALIQKLAPRRPLLISTVKGGHA
jgi:hypothetical protein